MMTVIDTKVMQMVFVETLKQRKIIMPEYTKKQIEMLSSLKDLGSNELVDLFLNYHGLQMLDDIFYEYLIDEGVLYEN